MTSSIADCVEPRPLDRRGLLLVNRFRAVILAVAMACARGPTADKPDTTGADEAPDVLPQYTTRPFTPDERALLRKVYGIEDPARLYLMDATSEGVLKYDTRTKSCARCLVNSYRVGFTSIRRPEESWEELEGRVKATPLKAFPASVRFETTNTASLDPTVRARFEQMLADARHAGFPIRVTATYRSPLREAFLMRISDRTHTLTSLHSYGRAVDVVVGDGNLRHAETRRRWVEFRRWVASYDSSEFRLIGAPDRSWDWRHVELPSQDLGFRNIDSAIARARACITAAAARSCEFAPQVGEGR
jgi:uncharacterized protein YcbK (DUF882 family)